jgi:O-acetyl-ADP-ribose deacetylase (regulator of RNase III)
MIIEEVRGDLWDRLDKDRPAGSDQWRLVAHGCNLVGVMGAGFAATVRKRYPETYEAYKRDAKREGMFPESLGLVFHHRPSKDLNTIIFNCYTQILTGAEASKHAIEVSLQRVWRVMVSLNIADQPVYIPRIGAGIGGLDYEKDVKPILENSPLNFIVFYL